jgi:hypothetical protein
MTSNSRKNLISMFLAVFTLILVNWAFFNSSFYLAPSIKLPDSPWEKIYFDEINNLTKLSGIKELRKTYLSKDDLEVRIWRGFGLSDTEGILIRKIDKIWYAYHIKANNYINSTKTELNSLIPPKSGWETFWDKITEKGILRLPGNLGRDCEVSSLDGMSYVVEYHYKNEYRTYRYSMNFSTCNEAKKLEEIGEIFAEEFDNGEGTCKSTEWIACARFIRENKNK